MPYFRVDDGWWSHPKTLALSPAARDLWVRAGAYSMQHLTDGLLSRAALLTLGAKPRLITELVEVGYWEPILGGYQFHDWAHYQESAEVLRARRERARERMRQLREKQHRTETEGAADVRANVPGTRGERAQEVSELSPSHPITTYLEQTSSVPETSRDARTDDEALPESEYIAKAAAYRVDFRKVHKRLNQQAGTHVPAATAWQGVIKVLARGGERPGDRTGLVLTSLRDDWPQWEQVVLEGAS